MEELGFLFLAACLHGEQDDAEGLLQQGVDIDFADDLGFTAFLVAAGAGHLTLLAMLSERGANTNVLLGGRTVLMFAASLGQSAVTTYLIEHCGQQVDFVDYEGWTALLIAALHGFLPTVIVLAAHGADITHLSTHNSSPCSVAAQNGHLDVVTWLAEAGCDLLVRDNDGDDALMCAAFDHRPDVCLFLISRDATLAVENNNGETALSGYAKLLDEDHPLVFLGDDERLPLTAAQKDEQRKILSDARALHVELKRRDECYQRRKDAMTFLQGYGFLLTAAQREARKAEEAQVDTHAKLAAIDRSTKEANLKYLTDRVFGDDKGRHVGREIVMML